MVAVLMPEMASLPGLWLSLGVMVLLVALSSLVRIPRTVLVAIVLVALVLVAGLAVAEAFPVPCTPLWKKAGLC